MSARYYGPWMDLSDFQYSWIEFFAQASWGNNERDRLTDNFPFNVVEGAD